MQGRPPEVREERRVVTTLFADLVGSTSLGERLEPGGAEADGRSMAIVKPGVRGWWEFGKTSSNFADLDLG